MSNLKNSQPSSPPPVAHYEFIYEDEVQSQAALMAHDEREYWKLMLNVDADETINQAKLDYLKEHIAALQEEYALLTKAIKALATTGKNWMIDAAKHPADVRGPQRKKFTKIREDHGVVTLESNARSKQAALKDEIKMNKELYRSARSILLHRTAVHKRRKADKSEQSKSVTDANSQGFDAADDEVRSLAGAAPDQSDQSKAVADAISRGYATEVDEVRSCAGAAPDQYGQPDQTKVAVHGRCKPGKSYAATFVSLRGPPSNEAGDSTDAAVGQYGQSNDVTVAKLQGATGRESEVTADGNIQDFFDEHEVRGSADAAADQYDQFEDQSPESANQFIKAATNCLANIANHGRADTTGRSLEEPEEKLPPDLRREVSRRRSRDRPWDIRKLEAYLLEVVDLFRVTYGDRDLPHGADATKAFTQRCSSPLRPRTRPFKTSPTPECNKTSRTHSAKLEPVYQDLNEPSSGSEPDNVGPDQNVEGSEGFDDATKDTQTKNTGTYAILSNKENGAHRTTLLECVKVTVGHPTDKSQQCETVLLLDSASDHTYFKRSLCEKLHLPNLEPTMLNVATFPSSDEIPVDSFISQLRIRTSNGKTICLRVPVMPDQFVGQMRTTFGRPEHIKELRQGSCAVCPSTETPEMLVGRDLRHLFEVLEEHKPLPCGFLLVHSNVGTMLVGPGRADKPVDESELSNHRSFFVRAKSDDVSIDQLLEPLHADANLAQNIVSRLCDQLEVREPHKVLHVSERAADQKLADLLHQMHSLEQMGVERPSHMDEDDAVHQRIRDTIRCLDGDYANLAQNIVSRLCDQLEVREPRLVGLPWRTSDGQHPTSEELRDNFKYAFSCLQALIKTLCKESLFAEYDKIIKEYLASGIISAFTSRPSHYLSHHAVIKRSAATTKTRPVFYGSAKPDKTSPSMNDKVHKGPVLLNLITAVLLNSRLASYVLTSDIAKAFLQVAPRSDEKRFCCYLWVRELTRPATGDNMVTYCFNRVIFGLRPSPALLVVDIEKHIQTVDTPLSRDILATCYVANTYRPGRPTAVDRVVDMWMEQARRLQTFWSTRHESTLLGSLEKGTRPDKTTSNNRPKGQTAHALIGQYVLVKGQSAPQFNWKRAQTLDLIESSDGVIRTATIRLPSGTVSRRAINHLYPIEVELKTGEKSGL